MSDFSVVVADHSHAVHAPRVHELMQLAANDGATIAVRSVEEILAKIEAGLAVMAFHDNKMIGFAFASIWEGGRFVSNSGLIVDPKYRHLGLARLLKERVLGVSRDRFPDATPFSLTMSGTVMKLNTAMGFVPVTYGQITADEKFWRGCQTCPYYPTLNEMKRKACFCTALVQPRKRDN